MKKSFISEEGFEKIKNHKYNPGKLSIVDKIISAKCESILKYVPETIAPNMITLIGVGIQFQSSLVLYFLKRVFGHVPQAAFIYCALSLFLYQIMDILDGKQARRLKRSSPLGQLFDHGLDSVASSSIVYNLGMCLNIFHHPIYSFIAMFILLNAFYLAQVGEYHTGVLDTTTLYDLGVIEIHYVIIGFYLITALFGGGIWETLIFGLKLKKALIFIFLICTMLNMKLVYENCIKYTSKQLFLYSVIPYFSIIICTGIIFSNPFTRKHQEVIFFTINFIYNQNCMKMIICAMSKMKFRVLQQELVIMFAFVALIIVNWKSERMIQFLTFIFFCLCASNLVYFWCTVVRDIAGYLKINILTL